MAINDSAQMLVDKIKVLELVRDMLKSKNTTYICHCLPHVMSSHPYLIPAARNLKFYVLNSIAPHYSLSTWIHARLSVRLTRVLMSRKKLRETRIAWVDWMIDSLREDLKSQM